MPGHRDYRGHHRPGRLLSGSILQEGGCWCALHGKRCWCAGVEVHRAEALVLRLPLSKLRPGLRQVLALPLLCDLHKRAIARLDRPCCASALLRIVLRQNLVNEVLDAFERLCVPPQLELDIAGKELVQVIYVVGASTTLATWSR